jgi:predicted GIY-YIG superfamily endonuclease
MRDCTVHSKDSPILFLPGDQVALPLSKFLTLAQCCPPEWLRHDLYLLRDDEVVFYVGQSHNAFERVWEHLRDGFKGRSTVGRFVLCNWPRAMRFIVELLNSQAALLRRDAAERRLIEQYAPCFNEALNERPTPLPSKYTPPDASVRHPRSLKKMMLEAEYAVRYEIRHRVQEWGE